MDLIYEKGGVLWTKKQLQLTYKELQNTLTARDFLQNAGLHKKDVLAVMDKGVWLEVMEKLTTGEVSCRNVLNLCSPAMESFAGSRPKGWVAAGVVWAYDSKDLSPSG